MQRKRGPQRRCRKSGRGSRGKTKTKLCSKHRMGYIICGVSHPESIKNFKTAAAEASMEP